MRLYDIENQCHNDNNQPSQQCYPNVSRMIKINNQDQMLKIVNGEVKNLNINQSNTDKDVTMVDSKRLIKKLKRDSRSHNHSKPPDNPLSLVEYLPNDYQLDTSFQSDFQTQFDLELTIFPELIFKQDSSYYFNEYGLSNIVEETSKEPTEPGIPPNENSSQNNQLQTQFHANNNIDDHNQSLEEDVTIGASKITNSTFLCVPITPELTSTKITPTFSTNSVTTPPTPTVFAGYENKDSVLPKPIDKLTPEELEEYFKSIFETDTDFELMPTFEDNQFTNNLNNNNQSEAVKNTYTSYNDQYNSNLYNNNPYTNVRSSDSNRSYSSNQLNSENNISESADTFNDFEKLIEYNKSDQNANTTNQTTNGSCLPFQPVVRLTDKQIEKAKIGKFQKLNEYQFPLDLQRHGLTQKEKKRIVSTDGITKRKRANKGGQKVMTKEKIDEFNRQTEFILKPQFRSMLTLKPALAGSLKCAVDYGNYNGDDLKQIQQVPQLTNTAVTAGPCTHKKLQDMPAFKNCDKRMKYSRDLTDISKSVTNMVYNKNEHFDQKHPYNPQWFRGELDSDGNSISKTKCGLCPYCPTIRFFGYRNGGYLGHLASDHGICSNNYLVPEGINFGIYNLPKSDTDSTLIESTGVECPYCHVAVKVGAQKNKNELLGYFRHWKTAHKDVTMNNSNTEITGHFRANIGNKKD